MFLQLCERPFPKNGWIMHENAAFAVCEQEKSYYLEKLIVRLSDINCFILLLNCIFFAAFFSCAIVKNAILKNVIGNIVEKRVCKRAAFWLEGTASIFIF